MADDTAEVAAGEQAPAAEAAPSEQEARAASIAEMASAEASAQERKAAKLEKIRKENEEAPAMDDDEWEEYEAEAKKDSEKVLAEAAADKLTKKDLRNAARMGLSQEQAEELHSKGIFDKIVDDFDELAKEELAEGADDTEEDDEEAPPVAPPKKVGKDGKAIVETAPVVSDLPELNDEYEPGLIEYSKKMKAAYSAQAAELKALKSQVAELTNGLRQREEVQRTTSMIQTVDSEIVAATKGHEDIFGKGELGSLKPDSPERLARAEVLREIAITSAGYAKLGKKEPPLKELVRRALLATHGDKMADKTQKLSQADLKKKLDARRGMGVSRPTNRAGSDALSKEDRDYRDFVEKRKELAAK